MFGLVLGCLDLIFGWTCILGTVHLEGVCVLVGCDYGVCVRERQATEAELKAFMEAEDEAGVRWLAASNLAN